MTVTKPQKAAIPIHPLFMGLYPVLVLYYINIEEMSFAAIWQAFITAVVITVIAYAFFLSVLRSWTKAALSASFTLLLVFTYGHIFNIVNGIPIAGIVIGRHKIMLSLWIFLYLIGLYLIVRLKTSGGLTKSLNIITISMTAVILLEIGVFFVQSNKSPTGAQTSPASALTISNSTAERDVYYILIDAYSRSDLLQDQFDIDSTEFVKKLTDMGFYIPKCAQSNYDTTYTSLTSSLNMNYLDALSIDQKQADPTTYSPYIHHSLVRKLFEGLGYQTITFKLPHPTIDIGDSTYYFDYFKNASVLDQSSALNFQYLFLNTTIFRPLIAYAETQNNSSDASMDWFKWLNFGSSLDSREYKQYQQNVFALKSLTTIPQLSGKKFVYAHLLITHQPYVFYPDGTFHAGLQQDDAAYRDQILFADKRIPEVIESILMQSNPKPIIIIQSDHSYVPGVNRVKILNAYYLPDSNNKGLYDTITPVNSFRLIFNTYFGGKYEMLPDVSRYVYSKTNNTKDIRIAPSRCVQ